MVVNKDSPNRRRSIAAPSHSQPSIAPRRRRAHSVALRTSLSPLAKARRSLVPRKSILKAPFAADDSQTESQSTLPITAALDDNNVTQSMDITQDFQTKVHDNTSRKSFGRRVSFAEHAHVRLFQIPDTNHTNSTGSPQSSPRTASPESQPQPNVTDENDYPNAANFARRRRSSIRYSINSEDMDLTTVGPSTFMLHSQATGSAILDEEFDDDFDEEGDDMEVTQVIQGDFARKRSLSMGTARRVSVALPPAMLQLSDELESDPDQTQSSMADESILSDAPSDRSQAMEFTVPLNKSLRPPAHEDEAWMALRQATHSGDTPYEAERSSSDNGYMEMGKNEMPLDDAVHRLMRARDSFSRPSRDDCSAEDMAFANQRAHAEEDTISSIDSLESDDETSNKTLNLSRVLGRVSSGGMNLDRRISAAYLESSMDESEIYGNIVATRQSLAPSREPERPVENQAPAPIVFHRPTPPASQTSSQTPSTGRKISAATIPSPFSFTHAPNSPAKVKVANPPSSPSKAKPKPVFTAAFAPPVARPSPKKSAKVPTKRSRLDESDIENVDTDKPSPAKRQALAGKWLGSSDPTTVDSKTATSVNSPKPKPLSPSKKAPFQATTTPVPQQQPSALRRPSGYFARRKSLAVGFASNGNGATTQATTSPKKRAAVGMGRASMGSASSNAWSRTDKDAVSMKKGLAKHIDKRIADSVDPPQSQDGAVVPDEESLDPSPASRHNSPPASPANAAFVDSADHGSSNVDLSEMLGSGAFGDSEDDEPMSIDKTEQWRGGVEEGLYDDEDIPVISISQFFSMTAIKFMDELTAPRRSTHPSQQPSRQPRATEDIPLAEYAVAMAIDIPQLSLYSRVSKDLEAWIEKSKVMFSQAEEEAAKITPELFVEYARAEEEGQAELLHQLNFIKTNTRGLAKSDWYDWKLKWVEGLRMTADEAFADLESDARKLEILNAAADELIPGLEKEYAEIMNELEREEAEVVEIEASDQDYLNELKASIAEQNIEVEALKAEAAESNDQFNWLQERLQETEAQKRDAAAAIATAERALQIQKNSTRSEVFQLKDELEALEDLHLTRVIKVNAHLFEYIYDSTLHISIPCQNFLPIVPKITITRLGHSRTRSKDHFPKLSTFFLTCAKEIISDEMDLTVRQVIHKLGDYWSSCAQLRSHLNLLNIKYPIEIETSSADDHLPIFKVRTMVMFPRVLAKAFITFIFRFETFSHWPVSIESLNCELEVGYGPIDRSTILTAVVDRLAQATPSDSYAILDACIEAQNVYH